jgi:nucleotide-binding universal stress UspA family protein
MKNLKAILCPIDFSSNSIEALQYAARLSKKMKVRLAILHVNDEHSVADIQQRFDKLALKYLKSDGIDYEFAIGRGEEKDEILRFNKIFKANLVVMGRRGSSDKIEDQTGSTTEYLVNSGKVAVLSIPEI